MNNIDYARALLREAQPRIDVAASQVKWGRHAYVVRQSQEAVELSLKAALRLVGVEFPKEHDVSDALIQNSTKYPSWFSEGIPSMDRVSKELVQKKIPSMYGEEARGKGPGNSSHGKIPLQPEPMRASSTTSSQNFSGSTPEAAGTAKLDEEYGGW